MASVDAPEKNRDFAKSIDANFVILSDPTKDVARSYGVLSPSGYARRQTFYIDADGVIRHIDRSVSPGGHGQEIADRLASLGFPRAE